MQPLASWLVSLLLDLKSYHEPFTPGRAAVNGLDHSLQAATRAEEQGMQPAEIVMALVHDAARPLNDVYHGETIAEIMRGHLPEACIQALRFHDGFQSDLLHDTSTMLWRYGSEPWYQLAVRLAELDAMSFMTHYKAKPFFHFLPMLEEIGES